MAKAKKAKKYAVSRGEIDEQLGELTDRLSSIDTFETTPSDVLNEISDIISELESLRERVIDEA